MKKVITELKCRLKSQTPVWFKMIRRAAVKVTSTCIALLGASLIIPGFALPEIITRVCTYIIVAGITAGLVSTTACQTPPNN